ncbi:hypothetical protein CDEST_09801 [Colletotrichum destructivum]|uniref:ABM domain-containing protein n=1 Tax=Colletotrichum destructivum TaxID=34406 RepID=A0AAX4INN4_9PEZI|nr:hypothetical protein CDEST_09801 [Colletotrichum destructivum]
MSQVVELSWLPVKQDFETSSDIASVNELQQKVNAQSDLLGQWEGVQPPNGLDRQPVKAVHLAAVWKSVEAAEATKQSPEAQEVRKAYGQVIDISSALPWTAYFDLAGGDFDKVASANVVFLAGSYLPADVDTAAFYQKWQDLVRSGGVTSGFVAGAHGWSVGHADYRGEKKKVFMVVTGWDSKESCQAATGGDKRARFAEALKEFDIQETEHACENLKKIK